MRVLVTVGTHQRGFDALLNSLEPWASKGRDSFVVQAGASTTVLPGARQQAWFTREEFAKELALADLVVAHLGCGIAREVQVAGKPCLFVPRRQERGEHIDDHQEELREALGGRTGLGFASPDDDLEAMAGCLVGTRPLPPPWQSDLVRAVRSWLTQS
ncbi:MAG: glycosyltransferase [Planctomycetota bacterium]